MRRKSVVILLAVVALTAVFLSPCRADVDLQAQAIDRLKAAVVKALPEGKNMARIAVLDFRGDDRMVKNAVTSAINEKTPHRVMERADFDRILAEQGLQLKDIMDERTRIRHGRLKGVQGLLMGDVYGMERGFMSYTIKAHVRLVDVEKGEVALSRDFNVTAVSSYRRHVVMGAAGLVILLLLLFFVRALLRRRRASKGERVTVARSVAGNEMAGNIDRIIGHVSDAKSRLVVRGKVEDAAELKDIERSLMEMKRSVANRPRTEGRGPLDPDREIFWKLDDIERLSGKISGMAGSASPGDVGKEISLLKTYVVNADRVLLHGRSLYL